MARKRLFLIDGMSHVYRAYYAIRNLSNSKGFPTNAVYGFTVMLRKLVSEEKPEYLAVALDPEGPTVRHERFEAYKATRKPMPDDLVVQLPFIRRVCEALRVTYVVIPGYEADDVIGTLARKANEQGLTAVLVTSDKDMLQLVSDHTVVMDPMKNNLLDAQKVVEKFGVAPEQVPDLLGLWGDSSDNIPGAPGIGEKGARELIQEYGTVEKCLASWEQVKRKTYKESLRDNAEQIRLSKELATIHQDLPIELDLEKLQMGEPDRGAARELFAELGFQSLARDFIDEAHDGLPPAGWVDGGEASDLIENLARQDRVYIAPAFSEDRSPGKEVRAVAVGDESGAIALLDLRNPMVRARWMRLLETSAAAKTCWDSKALYAARDARQFPPGYLLEDLMLKAFLTAPHSGDYSLRRWALEQLHVTWPEAGGRRDDLLESINRGELAQRIQAECDAVRRLDALLSARLEELELQRVYREIEIPLVPVLAEMELTGIKVRHESLKELASEMESQLSTLTGRIYQAAGTEFNINSPKQLGEILFEKLNLPMMKKTRKTKGYSTDQGVLEELAQSYELPRLILDYRQVAKLKSTYVDTLPQLIDPQTGRLHTSFNQTGAATGRLSSSDPNLQNIPVRTEIGRRIREAFVPEEGCLLISADYSQVELRVLAHLSRDEVLLDAYRNDQDIHERTAIEVFGSADPANRSEWRRWAKVINYGIVYGLSAFGLAQRLGIPKDKAQAFIDAYFERYKGIRSWLDLTIEEARRTGVVRTLYGRIRPIPDINSKDYSARQFAERTAVNSPIQGTAADIIKIAMIMIQKSLQKNSLSSKILLQVHDELVLESPESEVDKVREILRKDMEGAADLLVPLKVDLSVADNWKDMK